MGATEQQVNISLEDHLLESLKIIFPILPENLGQSLSKYLRETPPHIPYSILTHISEWSRTEEGRAALKAKDVDAASYTTVALLAGTLTSPERKFGNYVPPKDPDVIAAERARERRVITALANSVLSVTAVGIGAYWASEKAGWRNEWRTLFALFSAVVVAISEAGLFLIWQWRNTDAATRTRRELTSRDKKVDPTAEVHEEPEHFGNKMRRRRK